MEWNDIQGALNDTLHSGITQITSPWFYIQAAIVLIAAGLSIAAAAFLRDRMDPAAMTMGLPAPLRVLIRVLRQQTGVIVFVLLTWLARIALVHAGLLNRGYLLATATSLASAWIIIRLATSLIHNQFVVRVVSLAAWTVAALSIIGRLDDAEDALDSVSVMAGALRVTPLLLIKVTVLLGIALWLTGVLSNFLETRITRSHDLTPSIQVLLIKLMRVLLIVVAIAVVMSMVGIDLSAFALFSGAIGVGIGFGLQKIIANFISGVILLADKSVKPGDLVTIGDSSGRISAMNTRYISVAAGDGREFLIPNEDLITQKVVNWTYTDRNSLVKVNFATNYEADPARVCEVAVQVASAHPRVMSSKPPGCLLSEFTDTGMKFSLTFWIEDAYAGMDNLRSDVMLALWKAFKAEDIRVPYPVREIRVRGGALPVETVVELPGAG
ncbi:MAG: mechanosensitive ion channel [Bradyrhizobiaceae bacterium]|nr:MAG: mechanosensitive ion channel [Bradyrhizobiaceae bacterium]